MTEDELRIRFEKFWRKLWMERIYLALHVYAEYVDDSVFHFPHNYRVQLRFKALGIIAHDRILNKDRR